MCDIFVELTSISIVVDFGSLLSVLGTRWNPIMRHVERKQDRNFTKLPFLSLLSTFWHNRLDCTIRDRTNVFEQLNINNEDIESNMVRAISALCALLCGSMLDIELNVLRRILSGYLVRELDLIRKILNLSLVLLESSVEVGSWKYFLNYLWPSRQDGI